MHFTNLNIILLTCIFVVSTYIYIVISMCTSLTNGDNGPARRWEWLQYGLIFGHLDMQSTVVLYHSRYHKFGFTISLQFILPSNIYRYSVIYRRFQSFYQIYANGGSRILCAMHHGKFYNVPWDLDDCIIKYKHLWLMLNI